MSRRATKTAPPHLEAQDETETAPEVAGPEGHGRRAGGEPRDVSKSDAARAALSEGIAGPQEAVAFIKKQFGIVMAPQHFSAVKSQLKKRAASGAPRGKPGRKPKSAGSLALPTARRGADESDLLESLEALKPLIAQYGREKLKRLVDLLG